MNKEDIKSIICTASAYGVKKFRERKGDIALAEIAEMANRHTSQIGLLEVSSNPTLFTLLDTLNFNREEHHQFVDDVHDYLEGNKVLKRR